MTFKELAQKLDDKIAKSNHAMRIRGWFGDFLKQQRGLTGRDNLYDMILKKEMESKQEALEQHVLSRLISP